MNSSAKATGVRFDEESMWVVSSDGCVLGVPLAWFPKLHHSAPEQRQLVRISSRGLHWEALNEDLSIAALLAGLGDQSADPRVTAASASDQT